MNLTCSKGTNVVIGMIGVEILVQVVVFKKLALVFVVNVMI